MANPNEAIVEEFCDAWKGRDVDAILAYFHDDAVYHNIPLEPAVGPEAIRAIVEMFVPPADAIEFVVHHMFSNPAGDMVFTERTDRFVMDGKTIELPVAGVFELRDGKIAAWRDYFDLQSFMSQSAS